MYHQVSVPERGPEQRYFVAPTRFKEHLRAMLSAGYRPCSLAAFLAWSTNEASLPANSLLLTFDDGYRGVYEHAYPLLAAEAVPFAVFVVTSAVGLTDNWLRGTNSAATKHRLMSRAELTELARAGIGIGSHSRHHADLQRLDADDLEEEIAGSRAELEDMLGQKVNSFAYPYGRLNDAVRASVVKAGYACAFSTRSGFNQPGEDPFTVRRIDVYGTDSASALLRKLRFGTNDGSLLTAGRYYAKRALEQVGLTGRQ